MTNKLVLAVALMLAAASARLASPPSAITGGNPAASGWFAETDA